MYFRSTAIESCLDVPLIVGCSIAGILNVVFVKKRDLGWNKEGGVRAMTEEQKGRLRIYMGTFRIVVSIGLFENFHRAWATIFKLSRRVMPRAPSVSMALSLSQPSAGLAKWTRKVLPTPNSFHSGTCSFVSCS